jgi:hypothetical protein
MLLTWSIGSLITAVLLLSGIPGAAQQAVAFCRPPDAFTERTLDDLRALLSSSDSVRAAMRHNLGLTYAPTPTVTLIQDEEACRTGVEALNRLFATPDARRAVYLYQLGRDVGVEDPEHGRESEYRGIRIFTKLWEYRSTLLTF